MIYSSQILEDLRRQISRQVSEKRFSHILGVERCAVYLGEMILPELISELSAAALLHDVAKEIPIEEQMKLLEDAGFALTDEDKITTGVIHSFTAPIIIKKDFPTFATENILSAVAYHTVGRVNMTAFEKIIFVSDYCEDTRKYDSCKRVRAALLDNIQSLTYSEKLARLDEACIMSIDGALEALNRMNSPINSRMYDTRNSLLKN